MAFGGVNPDNFQTDLLSSIKVQLGLGDEIVKLQKYYMYLQSWTNLLQKN